MTDSAPPQVTQLSAVDRHWLAEAVAAGKQGDRRVRPNPQVGCALVLPSAVGNGHLVASGHHAQVGGPHAEVVALRAAGAAAGGCTAYVTLEPCNHTGRTGPCSEALIAAGVSRVVIGWRDPHPTAGGGAERLAAAGLAVTIADPNEPVALACAELADVFLVNHLQHRAYVQLKLAATLDGRTAAADGTSRWITGPTARKQVHLWRQHADAVLIGSGTALADNPRLDLRELARDAGPMPLRVVLDRRLRLQPTSHLAQTEHQPTLVYVGHPAVLQTPQAQQLMAQGVGLVVVPETASSAGGDKQDWLQRVLQDLAQRNVHHVLCEGGATLAAALLADRLVDRIDLLLAPLLLGAGRPLIDDMGIRTLPDAHRWRWTSAMALGEDVWLTALQHRGVV